MCFKKVQKVIVETMKWIGIQVFDPRFFSDHKQTQIQLDKF
jgi:hypothetical protein